ncbi:VCBS repeat-containing protein [Rhodobacter sp. JA431]|uniref:Ig-like domain-containing protein n=1 Tax=Rhodobacter sp. JA431 TaxID=570013 RepID=UPI000BD00EF0|nr:Ig-like domain-containing protein [Rhodobacter sp. JA431]SOB91611.1 VCBS repeat-containing protein [Rhodobacter sp. JA431]
MSNGEIEFNAATLRFEADLYEDIEVTSALLKPNDVAAPVFELLSTTSHGVLKIEGGDYTYTPSADYYGEDTFTYRVLDGSDEAARYTIYLNVASVNDAPETSSVARTTAEEVAISGLLTATDVEGNAFSFALDRAPSNGTASILAGGNYTYTPNENFVGTDRFTYTVTDSEGGVTSAEVTVEVTGINDAPTNVGTDLLGDAAMLRGGSVGLDLSGIELADVDATSASVGTLTLNATPGAGTLSIGGDASALTVTGDGSEALILTGTLAALNSFLSRPDAVIYTDTSGTAGTISASYSDDGASGSGGALSVDLGGLQVAFNTAPVAQDTSFAVSRNGTLNGQLLASDVDHDTLNFATETGPSRGTLTLQADGSFDYVPYAGFSGTDSFTYTVSDGFSVVRATAVVTISATATPPTVINETGTTDEDAALSGRLDAFDPNGGTLAFALAAGGAPTHGTVEVSADGHYRYTPDADFDGEDGFTFVVTGAAGLPSYGTATITVRPVEDAPVVQAESFSLIEDGSLAGQLGATDADGDVLVYSVTTLPSLGSLELNPDGSFIYTPDANANGMDSFSYEVSDGTSAIPGTVSLTIAPQDDAPVADDLTVGGPEDTVINGQLTAQDGDGDAVTWELAAGSEPAFGTLNLSEDGSFTYTPDANANGTEVLTLTARDGALSDTATLTIHVTPVNDAPVAVADPDQEMQEDSTAIFDLAGNDTDVDGDALMIIAVEALHGVAEITADGQVRYTPEADYFGPEVISYTISDGQGGTDTNSVQINILSRPEIIYEGTEGDDTFEIRGTDGRLAGFYGGGGTDTVVNAGRIWDKLNLTGTVFDSIETLDAQNGVIVVDRDGAMDLSTLGQLVNARRIEGDRGNETITGSQQGDVIRADRGDDQVFGAGGDDHLSGEEGADRLSGGEGADTLVGGEGADALDGGAGDDQFLVAGCDGRDDTVSGGTGYDIVRNAKRGGYLDLTGASFEGVEEIDARGGWIRVSNGALDLRSVETLRDVRGILGTHRNEVIGGSRGDDLIDAGHGWDVVLISGSVADASISNIGRGRAIVESLEGGRDQLYGVEELRFDDYTLFLDGRDNLPFGAPDAVTIGEDAAQSFAVDQFLANDFDIGGGPIAITGVSGGTWVTAAFDGSAITLNPNGAFEALGAGQSAEDTMTYQLSDAAGQTVSVAVTVTVMGANDAPVAVDDRADLAEGTLASGNLLINDTDIDTGDALQIAGLEGGTATAEGFTRSFASGAVLDLAADGTFTFTAGPGYQSLGVGQEAVETVTYTVADAHGATSTATLSLHIAGLNDAPDAADDDGFITTARGSIEVAADGVLSNDTDIDAGDQLVVSGVSGGVEETFFILEAGVLVARQGFTTTGSAGGTFALMADGAWRFEAGQDFDDLALGESRLTSMEYTVSDGHGGTDTAVLSVLVTPSSYGSENVDPADLPDESEMTRIAISGTFEQMGGVDVLGELFARLDDSVDFDLASLLDMDLIDIDTRIQVSYGPDTGLNVDITDNNPDSTAMLSGFGAELDAAADYLTGFANPILTAPITPVYFGPTFEIDATIMAKLGWDIDLPSLGRTAIFQPIEIDLLVPDSPVQAWQNFVLWSDNLVSLSPTTVLQTVGIGDITIDAGYGLTDLTVSNVGLSFGTQDFLGLDIDGLAEGFVGLNHEFNLLAALGVDEDGAGMVSEISLSFEDVLDGLIEAGIPEFFKLVSDFVNDPSSATITALGRYIQKAVGIVASNAATTYNVGGAELKPSELQALSDRARFNDFDIWDADGRGLFTLETPEGETIHVTADLVNVVIETTGIDGAVGTLRQLLTVDGFTPIEGLTLTADLPIGNVDDIEGFVNDGEGTVDTTARAGTSEIEVTQITRLAGVSFDYEKFAPAVVRIALDKATEAGLEAAKAQPELIPIIIGANIAANAALIMSEEAQKTAEEGFTLSAEIKQTELVAELTNGVGGLLNSVAGAINSLLGLSGSNAIPMIAEITAEQLETSLDTIIDGFAQDLVTLLKGITGAASEVFDFIANDPTSQAIIETLGGIGDIAAAGMTGIINTLRWLVNTAADVFHIDVGLSPVLSIFDNLLDIAEAGPEAISNIEVFIRDIVTGARDYFAQVGDDIELGINTFADFVKDLARGIDLQLSTDFDLIDFVIEAGIDLVQVARFDPDEVQVTYMIDGVEVTGSYDEAAQFLAAGAPGDVLNGEVAYSFSGAVDYDYILRLDIAPTLELYGFDIAGSLGVGDGSANYDLDFDYAAIKLTDDFTLEDLGSLNFGEAFDDALLELPFGLFEDVANVVVDEIRESFGELAGQTTDLDYNEIRLFTLEDVEIGADRFTQVVSNFQVEIGGAIDSTALRFSAAPGLQVSGTALIDALTEALAKVEGSAANIGRLMPLDGGGAMAVGANGTVIFDAEGDFETLNEGEETTQTFRFTVTGADGTPEVREAELTIVGVNDAPVAIADAATMVEDGTLSFDPAANDSDVDTADAGHLTVVAATCPDGAVEVSAEGLVTFRPAADFNGTTIISYTVADPQGATAEGTATVTVTPVGDMVRAADDVLTVSENGTASLDVTLNDIEVDGEMVTITGFTQPSAGQLTQISSTELAFDPDGDFEYLAAGETVDVTADVQVSDGVDGVATSRLTITVVGENDAPVASDDQVLVAEDGSVTIDVLANDTDVDGDALTATVVAAAAHGTVSAGPGGTLIYRPDANYHGEDSFSYEVSDGHGGKSQAVVQITVDPEPEDTVQGTAGDDVFSLNYSDGFLTLFEGGEGYDLIQSARSRGDLLLGEAEFASIEELDLRGGRIHVNRDGFLDLSSIGLVQGVAAIVGDRGDESITGSQQDDAIYGGFGDDVLAGMAGDDLLAGERGSDQLLGGSGNDWLDGGWDDDTVVGGEGDDTLVVFNRAAANDVLDGGAGWDVLRNDWRGNFITFDHATITNIERLEMQGGRIELARDGVLDLASVLETDGVIRIRGDRGAETIIGTQSADEIEAGEGADYVDGQGGDDTFFAAGTNLRGDTIIGGTGFDVVQNNASFRFWWNDLNITGTVFEDVELFAANGARLLVDAGGSADLSTLTELRDVRGIWLNWGDETVALSLADDVVYGGDGTDTAVIAGSVFDTALTQINANTWRLDGPGGTDWLHDVERLVFDDLSLFIDGTNNAPVTRADAARVLADATLDIADLLANDLDPDGDALHVISVSSDEIGVSFADGVVTLDPEDRFVALGAGDEQRVLVTYVVADEAGAEAEGQLWVTVVGVNDAPVAGDDSDMTDQNTAISGDLLANDTDPDLGDTLSIQALNGNVAAIGMPVLLASGALVVLQADGSFAYDPNGAFAWLGEGESAEDSLSYTLADALGATAEGALRVVITGENDNPEDGDEGYATSAHRTLSVGAAAGLLANGADPDMGDLPGVAAGTFAGSAGGIFTLNTDGSFSFAPNNAFGDLAPGETRDTVLSYSVTDGHGGIDTSTVTVTVTGATAPIEITDPVDSVITQVSGTFRQYGGVDVATYFIEQIGAMAGIDLDSLLDFTLIDINKLFTLSIDADGNLTFGVEDVDPPNGALEDFSQTVIDGVAEAASFVDQFLPLDLGPLTFTPVFDAQLGLDLEFGWDIDLPTLGKTNISQPVTLELSTPEEAAEGVAVRLSSGNLVSQSPTTTTEGIGLGRFAVQAGFALPNTQISNIGLSLASGDFLDFDLDGVVSGALSLDRTFDLGESLETVKEFLLDSLETIMEASGVELPVDINKIASTLLALDIGNMIEGLFSGDVDFAPLLSAIDSGDAAKVFDETLNLITTLSENGENVGDDIAIAGATASARDIWNLGRRAMFNEFDDYRDDGTGVFILSDEDGEPVEVTAEAVFGVIDAKELDVKADTLVSILSGTGISPIEGISVAVAAPIGNAEQIEGFADTADGRDTDDRDGLQQIEVRQVTRLIDVDVDLEGVQEGIMDFFVKAIMGVSDVTGTGAGTTMSPAQSLLTSMAMQREYMATLEDGFRWDVAVQPAELVTATVNGLFDGINAFGETIDSVIPGNIYTPLTHLSTDQTLDTIDAIIDAAQQALGGAFDVIETLLAAPAQVVREFVSDLLEAAESGIDSVLEVVKGILQGAGSTIEGLIKVLEGVPHIAVAGPFLEWAVAGPLALLKSVDSAIDSLQTGVSSLRDFIEDVTGFVNDLLGFDVGRFVDTALSDIGGFLKDVAHGAEMNMELGFDLFTAELSAGLELIQIAKFDPDEVTVTYTLGDVSTEAALGEEVTLAPSGVAGDTVAGTAEYHFSGDVDYEYRLKLDIDPNFTFLGVDLSGAFTVGEDGRTVEFSTEYALAALGEHELNEDGSLDVSSLFDEALIELPFDFAAEIVQEVATNIVNNLNLPGGMGFDEDEFILFQLDDIEIPEEEFTTIITPFEIDII